MDKTKNKSAINCQWLPARSAVTEECKATVAVASDVLLLLDLAIEVSAAAVKFSGSVSPNQSVRIEEALRAYEDPERTTPAVHPGAIPGRGLWLGKPA